MSHNFSNVMINITSINEVHYINQGKTQSTIEEYMVDFAAEKTLEVRSKSRLHDVVSLVAPGVEVQTDRAWKLSERR
jgi:hypothetical protein